MFNRKLKEQVKVLENLSEMLDRKFDRLERKITQNEIKLETLIDGLREQKHSEKFLERFKYLELNLWFDPISNTYRDHNGCPRTVVELLEKERDYKAKKYDECKSKNKCK